MEKPITLALALATMLAGGAAYAASAHTKADADANGVLTRAEAQASAGARFTRMDINKDGKIDQADRLLRREAMKTRMFERLDTDKNGQLTKTEFTAASSPRSRGQRLEAGGAGDMGTMHRGRGQGRRGGMMNMSRMADVDRNGAITQAEFQTVALQRFDTMDTNKDGQVTQAERQAARAQMKAQWQQQRAARQTPS